MGIDIIAPKRIINFYAYTERRNNAKLVKRLL